MLPNITAYHKPKSVAQAERLLQRKTVRTAALAGGTALLSHGDPAIEALVDLSGLGIDYIRQGADNLEIGAMATLQHMTTSPLLAGFADGLLATAAHHTATRSLRNVATIGGSILACGPATDVVVALLALDDAIVSSSGASLALPDLLLQRRLPRPMSLIVEVRIPSALAGWRAAFCRTARLPSDQAIVNVAVAVRYHQGFCADIHIAAGGIGNFPMRLPVAEHLLRGTGLTEAEIKHAIDRQQVEIEPPSDMLGSSEYRRALLGVLVRRAIRQCQAKENTT